VAKTLTLIFSFHADEFGCTKISAVQRFPLIVVDGFTIHKPGGIAILYPLRFNSTLSWLYFARSLEISPELNTEASRRWLALFTRPLLAVCGCGVTVRGRGRRDNIKSTDSMTESSGHWSGRRYSACMARLGCELWLGLVQLGDKANHCGFQLTMLPQYCDIGYWPVHECIYMALRIQWNLP